MSFIQARIGSSLAALYDVRGSIAGLEELRQEEIAVVHDMAVTAASERMSAGFRVQDSAPTNQNSVVTSLITGMPSGIFRIEEIAVYSSDPATDYSEVCVSLRFDQEPGTNDQEIPVWVWGGSAINARFVDGGVNAVRNLFRPLPEFHAAPHLMVGLGQPQQVSEIVLRGLTSGFGAGTTIITLTAKLSFFDPGGLNRSVRGLPVPSW